MAREETTVSRGDAARQVALASSLDGHDATVAALENWSVSPGHADVIVRATGELPAGARTSSGRSWKKPGGDGPPVPPDQLRRVAPRAIAAVEPDKSVVDAHENDLVRSEELAAQGSAPEAA